MSPDDLHADTLWKYLHSKGLLKEFTAKDEFDFREVEHER